MQENDIKKWIDLGGKIGAHTYSHYPLSRLSFNEQLREIQSNKDHLEKIVGGSVNSFAYPHGVEGTWNSDTLRVLEKLEFGTAMTCCRRIIDPSAPKYNKYEIPRFDVNDVFSKHGDFILRDSICNLRSIVSKAS